MKFLFYSIFLVGILSHAPAAMAQINPKLRAVIKDTFPVSLLKHQLTKREFINNYGIDDTSRALINMFFRKRTASLLKCYAAPPVGILLAATFFDDANNSVKKTGHEEGAGGFLLGGLLSGLTGMIILPVDGLINSITYSKKNLLSALVYRERGVPLPGKYVLQIKVVDFW
jgi:hypothetical protein